MLKNFSRIYIVVDALDKCTDRDSIRSQTKAVIDSEFTPHSISVIARDSLAAYDGRANLYVTLLLNHLEDARNIDGNSRVLYIHRPPWTLYEETQ